MIVLYFACTNWCPIGVQLLNENNLDEMCAILDTLHKYCPTSTSTEEGTLPNGDPHCSEKRQHLPDFVCLVVIKSLV